MKYKISKKDFDSLDDALKAHYKADGEDYVLNLEGHETVIQNAVNDALKAYKDKIKVDKAKEKAKDKTKDIVDPKPAEDDSTKALKAQVALMEQKLKDMQDKAFKTNVRDNVLKLANKKIRPEAIDDLVLHINNTEFVDVDGAILTKDGVSVQDWTDNLIKNRPLWVGENVSSNAKGGAKDDGSDNIEAKRKKLGEILNGDNITIAQRQEATRLANEIKSYKE